MKDEIVFNLIIIIKINTNVYIFHATILWHRSHCTNTDAHAVIQTDWRAGRLSSVQCSIDTQYFIIMFVTKKTRQYLS